MRRRQSAFVVAVVAVLVGCGDPSQPTAEDRSVGPIEEQVARRCDEPSEALVAMIAERLTVDAALEHVQVVVSDEVDDLQLVAAEVVGEQLDEEPPVGTWAVLGDPGLDPEVVSVNAVARYLSDWPDGTRAPHRLTMAVDGAEEAEECVDAAVGG